MQSCLSMAKPNYQDNKEQLEAFIKENQKRIPFSLKREINTFFNVRKFSALPKEKYPEALRHAKRMVTGHFAGKVLDEALTVFLKGSPVKSPALKHRLDIRLRERYGIEYWASMRSEDALRVIKEVIGNEDIRIFAFKHSDGKIIRKPRKA